MTRWIAAVLCLGLVMAPGRSAGAAEVDALFDALRKAPPGKARLTAAAAIIETDTVPVDDLVARLLERQWQSTPQERRELLKSFGAEVPDDDGRFRYPRGRPPRDPPPRPEWLDELARMPGKDPALLESLETVVILQALARQKNVKAGDALLDFAFTEQGLVFRDECGRLLREMEPYSLPALLRGSADKSKGSSAAKRRYSRYQLDRLEKGRPSYVLRAAPNDDMEAEMLRRIGKTRHPDAVGAVLKRTDSMNRTIRRAARAAWLRYVTGPPPPPSPMARRRLPGGKFTDEEFPLYLNYRDLATEEVRRVLAAETGEKVSPRLDAAAMTEELFRIYDEKRWAIRSETMARGKELLAQGSWEKAEELFDSILVEEPEYPRRAEMAGDYVAIGKKYAARADWERAAVSFNKALSIAPEGEHAAVAEEQLAVARAELARAAGKSGDEDMAAALVGDPGSPEAVRAIKERVKRERGWMLYVGGAAALVALALAAVVFVQRKRRHE